MKTNNKGFASTFLLFSLLVLFLLVMSILLFTMNNSSVLNSGLKSKLIDNIEKNEKSLNKVTVSLDANGGDISYDSGWNVLTNQDNLVSAYKTIRHGDSYNLPQPTKAGYSFVGWFNILPLGDIYIKDDGLNSNGKHVEYNIKSGVTYTVTMDNAVLKEGSTTKFSVVIYDFTTNSQLAIAEGTIGTANTLTLECPEVDDPTDKIRLIIYDGVVGSTAGKSIEFKNVKVGTMDTTQSAQIAQNAKVNYEKDHVLYAIWGVSVKAIASGGTIASTSGWTGTGSTATKVITQGNAYGTLPTISKDSLNQFKGWKSIPNGYIDLDYIDAPAGYYINTGYSLTNTSTIEVKYGINIANKGIFGCVELGNNNSYAVVDTAAANEKMYIYYGQKTQNGTTTYVSTFPNDITFGYEDNKIDVINIWNYTNKAVNFSSNKLGYNSSSSWISSDITFTTKNVYLFGVNKVQDGLTDNPVTTGGTRIYYLWEINHSDIHKSYVHYYVPCKRVIDGAIGMYDLITDKFMVLANKNSQSSNFEHSQDITATTTMGNPNTHKLYAIW